MRSLKEDARPGLAAGGRAGQGLGALGSSHRLYDSTNELFYNAKGQVVGRLEKGWLTKFVDTRVHQLHHPPAWCCDAAHIEQLRRLGGWGVKLIDEKGTEWRAPLDTFERFGVLIDRGHGRQVALPLAKWAVRAPGGPVQLSLEVGP